jgi:hypothetical protein
MTFLNPIFLWASLAVLIPIIVHLFNFRRPQKVLFSDISFVKEVKKSVVRRLRLRQWLVLAARCLAILALVAVFANPVWLRDGASARQVGNASVAVVLDNSYSMKAGNDKGDYWLQARKMADAVLAAHPRNDEFLVMTTSDLKLQYNFGDKDAAANELDLLQLRQNGTSLGDVFKLSEQVFEKAGNKSRILYFLSDFQQSTILSDSARPELPEGIDYHFVPLANRDQKNIYLQGAQVTTQVIEIGKPVNLKLDLVNDGKEPVKGLGIQVNVEGVAAAIQNQDIEANGKVSLDLPIIPKDSGWLSGYVEVDDNPIDFDNRRHFSFYVPLRERMLVVEEQAAPHIRLMFGGELMRQFAVDFVPARNFSTVDLSAYKSIVLLGVKELSGGVQDKLKAHLAEGKSLMVFPGEGMNLASMNAMLGSMKVGTFGEEVKFATGQYADGVDLEHPVFEGVFAKNGRDRKFDAPLVYRHFPFRPDNSSVQNTILRLSSGEPALVESRPGDGLVYVFSFFPETSWSDFTIKSTGLAMMIRLSLLMNQSHRQEDSFVLGTDELKKIKTKEKEMVRLVGEGGKEIIPRQHSQSGFVVLQFDHPDLREGSYRILQGEKFLEKISFNAPDAESKMNSLNKEALEEWVKAQSLANVEVTLPEAGRIADSIEVRRSGVPLWKYFLALGLFFILVEIVLLWWKEKP